METHLVIPGLKTVTPPKIGTLIHKVNHLFFEVKRFHPGEGL